MHILVAFDRFQNPLKKRAKKLQKFCFEPGQNVVNVTTKMNATWPRAWTKRGHEHERNVAKRDHEYNET